MRQKMNWMLPMTFISFLLPILLGEFTSLSEWGKVSSWTQGACLKVTQLAVIWTAAIWRQVSSCQTKCWLYTAAAARAHALLACKRKRTFLCIILKAEHFQNHVWHLQALRMLLLHKETKHSEDTEGSLSAQWDDAVPYGHLRSSHLLVAFKRTEHLTWRVWGVFLVACYRSSLLGLFILSLFEKTQEIFHNYLKINARYILLLKIILCRNTII